jgi:hypothetical protein
MPLPLKNLRISVALIAGPMAGRGAGPSRLPSGITKLALWELADWIAASGRRLSTIYITHGHPDYFLWPESAARSIP